jgi:uncharacterized LabA/DUF88 family protein
LSDERLKIAVFIDFDNIEIGVKTTLGTYFDIGSVLEAIKERGEIVTKVAYGDWTRAGDIGRSLSQHAVHMVQRNLTPGGDKNGADINLALDALEMAFTHNHINSFVIVSGDSDFISLVEKLKQYDRKVFVLGGRAFTSVVMQKNCTEFIAYENIVGRGRGADRTRSGGESTLAQAMPLVRRALKLLTDREVVPQLGLLKSTLLQLDSAFSEREYGAGSFRDFVQKLAKAGYVTLKGSERSFHVELREGGDGSAGSHAPSGHAAGGTSPAGTSSHAHAHAHPAHPPTPAPAPAPQPAPAAAPVNGQPAASDDGGTEATGAARPGAADAYRVIHQALLRATTARWPLYVRQVKQLIKAAEPQFDERRFGFPSLIEALKHCQREGLLRMERDRQGIVRVWPGPQLQKGGVEPPIDVVAGSVADTADGADADERQDEIPIPHEHEEDARFGAHAGADDEGTQRPSADPTAHAAEPQTPDDIAPGEKSPIIDAVPLDDVAEAASADAPVGKGRRRRPAAPRGTSGPRKAASGTGARKTTAPPRTPRTRKAAKPPDEK